MRAGVKPACDGLHPDQRITNEYYHSFKMTRKLVKTPDELYWPGTDFTCFTLFKGTEHLW